MKNMYVPLKLKLFDPLIVIIKILIGLKLGITCSTGILVLLCMVRIECRKNNGFEIFQSFFSELNIEFYKSTY